jgi:FkbM family methyltransferase
MAPAGSTDATAERSYSQHGEDLIFRRLLQRCPSRFVVDVGAHDGRSWSNSYLLGQLGYSLLLVEPMPQYAEQCRHLYSGRRDVIVETVAIGRQRGEAAFFIHTDHATDQLAMRSSLQKHLLPTTRMTEIRVPVRPLVEVLEKHRWPSKYALLTIDAEGSDLEVLETAAFHRWRPHVICVEEGDQATTVQRFLSPFQYRPVAKCGPNGIYVREEGKLGGIFVNIRDRLLGFRHD